MKNENASGNVNMSNLLANLNVVLTYLAKKSGDQNNKNNKNALFRGNNNYVRKNSDDNIAVFTVLPPLEITGTPSPMIMEEYLSCATGVSSLRITGAPLFWAIGAPSSEVTVLPPLEITGAPSSEVTVLPPLEITGTPSPMIMEEYSSCATGVSSPMITGARVMRPPPSIVEKKKEDANLLDSLDLRSVVKNLKENEKIARLASLIIQLIKENGGHVPGYAKDPPDVRVPQGEGIRTTPMQFALPNPFDFALHNPFDNVEEVASLQYSRPENINDIVASPQSLLNQIRISDGHENSNDNIASLQSLLNQIRISDGHENSNDNIASLQSLISWIRISDGFISPGPIVRIPDSGNDNYVRENSDNKIDKLASLIIQLIKENGGHVPGYAIDPTGVGVHQRENVETLTQFTSHENSSDDEQTIKVK